MTALEIIRIIATEFSEVEDETICKWIELSKPYVSKHVFGKDYEQALAYLVCHKMKMAGMGDNSGGSVADTIRVTSYSEGSTSIGYNNGGISSNSPAEAEYYLTSYGIQYISFRRIHVVPILISGGDSIG